MATGDYVKNGEEAKQFFSSIQLKEYKDSDGAPAGKNILLPMVASVLNFRMNHISAMMEAGYMMQKIKTANAQYRVIRIRYSQL